ncbi:MAG: hypothetical protein ABWZ88_15080 [Variovorax sp.]
MANDTQRKDADTGEDTAEDVGAQRGKTRSAQDGDSTPRLPHERDQSSDSQQNQDGGGEIARVGKQALDDVERGMVDTDRGPVTDKVYNDKVKR